jgi:hypothetical protein
MDIKSPKILYTKATLMLLCGIIASLLLLSENFNTKNILLIAIAIWGFSRAYYFVFYVIEKYIDPSYKFSGIISFLKYSIRKVDQKEEQKTIIDTQKKWDLVVSNAIKDVEASLLNNYPGFHHITFFGATDINPKYLAIWCFFKKNEDLKHAEEGHLTKQVQKAMKQALKDYGYPTFLLPSFFVSFGTDEEVQKTCAGNYWHYLK